MTYIKYWRRREGLSQEELAHRCGVHVNSVIRWENDQRQPRIGDVYILARVLGVTETELLYGPQRPELRVNFYWEAEEMDVMKMKANEFSWGHRNDGMLLLAGALPWDMSVDDILARIRGELIAAKEGKKARDEALARELKPDEGGNSATD